MIARLREQYNKTIKAELMKDLKISNSMAVPTLTKVMVNVGAGEAAGNSGVIEEIVEMIRDITGQQPIVNKARKAIAQFKIREGQDIGVSVTLRGERMWEFMDKLINVVLPRTKDFRGINPKAFDGAGNYSLGIREHTIFPEIDANKGSKLRSLQVTFVTTAGDDVSAKAFLDKFGFPFTEDGN